MATPPSSYGDRPPLQGYRRSFTAPSRPLSFHERAGLDKSDADADILYFHSNARIIAFSPPTESIQSQSKEILPDADYPIDAVETLPWRSRTETLASSGPIKIEKVRGSGHFLKSADQKVIQSIMRNSQCWCVDGESKFVLRSGKLKYYRIELPSETEEDKQKIAEFKTALGKVLRFERTPCPFKRAFHVELPEDAITPRRKGTWKRKQLPQPAAPNTDPLPLRRSKNTRAWSFQAQNEASPLQPYGRRGSDYGFSASRGSSRSRTEANGYRPSTPSSVLSSEDAYERRHGGGSSDDGQQGSETDGKRQKDGSPMTGSELGDSVTHSEHEHDRHELPDGEDDASPEVPIEAQEGPIDGVPVPSEQPQQSGLDASMSAGTGPLSNKADDGADESVEEGTQASVGETEHDAVRNVLEEESEASTSSTTPVEETSIPMCPEEFPGSNSPNTTRLTAEDDDASLTDQPPPHLPKSHVQGDDSDANKESPRDDDDDALSRVSSVDSFHTTDSMSEDILDEHVDAADLEKPLNTEPFTPFFLPKHQHQRGLSEMTVTASTVASSEESPRKQRPSTSDSTPGLATSSMSDSSWPEVHTPPTSPIQNTIRRRLQAKRSLSPLPPPTILYSPTTSPVHQGSPFTAQFMQKAANVALVKPIEAVALLVHILARIAGGATLNDLFSGDLFRRPSERERGSQHRRRTSFPDQVAMPRDDSEDDDEDDFGVPIRGRTRSVEASASPNRTTRQTVGSVREREDDQDSIFDLD